MPKKRNNFDGSIYEDKERGGYRVQIRLPEGKRITKRFKDPEEAVTWKNDQLTKLGKEQFVAPAGTTLGEWLLEWLRLYNKQNVRQRSFERNVSLAKHCQPISHYKLQELRPTHFQELYLELQEYSGETRKKVHNLLHQALDQAVNDKYIYSNPIDSVKAPKVVREEIETFAKEELQKILTTAKDHRLYPSLLFAATTGVRLGEMLGLRWQDVDLKEGCVRITQTLQHASTGIIFEEPKSKSSRRKISIPLVTIAALSKAKSASGDIVPPSSLCFVATNGSPIQPKNYHRWWTTLQKEANAEWQAFEKKKKALLAKDFSKDSEEYKDLEKAQNALKFHKKFHALRHTHATILLSNGEPVIEVSRRLGHSKPSVTLDIYGHAIPGHDQKIADKIAGLYGI